MASAVGDEKPLLVAFWTRYSSWSARVTLLVDYFTIPCDTAILPLDEAKHVSGSELLPAFRLPSSVALNTWINDSLAICEYLAEQYPEYSLWPKDGYLRALARSAAARMHSGFPALRSAYHTNFTAKYTGAVPVSEAARKEVEKALALWADSRKRTVARLKELGEKDEGFLFGSFGIADSFFWPVLWRIRTYGLPLDTAEPEAIAWMKTMWSDTKIKEQSVRLIRQAERPETAYPLYDDIFKGNPDVKYEQFTEDWEFTV